MYTNGSFNPSPGNDPPNQMHLPHSSHAAPPPQVQQGYICPPPASSHHFHSPLPPVSMLLPPPPLPAGARPPSQAFPNPIHPLPSFPLSLNGRALHLEGPVVEDNGSSKESSIHCDESKPEHASPLYTDPDIEMEDDITLPENEYHPTQPLNCGYNHVSGAYSNTEEPPPQLISAQTNSIARTSMNFQTNLPVSKSHAQLHQDVDDGSRQVSSSPYSGRANIVPECGIGDMYDPFVDRFEPTFVKLDCVQEHEPVSDSYTVPKASISSNRPLSMEENNQGVDKQALTESDMTGRVSVSPNKPPDIEENTTGNDIGAVTSGDNDEFSEIAENGRECNSHETLTPNSHDENPKAVNNVREVDSTRKKSQGDPKEKDSSRSMKLFKVALTNS